MVLQLYTFIELKLSKVFCSFLPIHIPNHLPTVGPDNITQPKRLNSGAEFDAAPMRLQGGSDANSGGFGWVGAKIAPYFFDWVGPYLIS